MQCQECGRKIKRGYEYNGLVLGIECYKAHNVYYNNPALAIYQAARLSLSGDNSLVKLLPSVWSIISSEKLHKEAKENNKLHGDDNEAYWLAILAHNIVSKKLWAMGQKTCSVGEYVKYK